RPRGASRGTSGSARVASHEREVLPDRLAALGGGPDRDVLGDAPQVVDHAAPDDAVQEAAIVRLDLRPRGRLRPRHLSVVDDQLVLVLALAGTHREVSGLA